MAHLATGSPRRLIVTADDFGIGPQTSRGILELARRGCITSTVLLVNSPYAEDGIAQWHATGQRLEIGWHPCLTLDGPVSAVHQVPTLVNRNGQFFPLGQFLSRLITGRISRVELDLELMAQYRKFLALTGQPPVNVNGHHHVHIFGPVRRSLMRILSSTGTRPFLRRVTESFRTLRCVPGARLKRYVLSRIGRRSATVQHREGFPGADRLIGITNPKDVQSQTFFSRWLKQARGETVELTCHPGFFDDVLLDRDGTIEDGNVERRPRELDLMASPDFLRNVRDAGFQLVTAADLLNANRSLRSAA